MFDLHSYCMEYGFPYFASGHKNVGVNWHATSCPSCGDSSAHCGISKKSNAVHCFKCGYKSNIISMIRKHLKCSPEKAKGIFKQYNNGYIDESYFLSAVNKDVQEVQLPFNLEKRMPESHKKYLASRKFDPDLLIAKYGLLGAGGYCEPKYRYRVIIPIEMDGKLVSFLGRGIYKTIEPRYYNAPATASIIPVKNALYGMEYVGNTAIIMEGVTDVWRFGSGAVSTMGADLTNLQLLTLKKAGVRNVCFAYDPDKTGRKKSEMGVRACALMGFNSYNYALEGDKDIGDRTYEEIDAIKDEIYSYI